MLPIEVPDQETGLVFALKKCSGVSQICFFYQRAIKWTLLPCAGQTNPLSDPLVEKKSCATREKYLFYSCGCYPRFARASNFTLAK